MLQSLEPDFFDAIGANMDAFVDDTSNRLLRGEKQDIEAKAYICAYIEKTNGLNKDELIELLAAVFPKVRRLFDLYGASEHWGDSEWLRGNRACADLATCSRYFMFRVEDGDISNKDLSTLIESANNEKTFKAIITLEKDSARLARMFERILSLDPAQVSELQMETMIAILFDIGDTFKIKGVGDFMFGAHTKAMRLIIVFMSRLHQPKRFSIALKAIRESNERMGMLVTLLGKDKRNGIKSENGDQLFEAEQITVIHTELALKLEAYYLNRSIYNEGVNTI